ncbi:hypothetical protein TorRG33x02_288900, partial [Trema orientale]
LALSLALSCCLSQSQPLVVSARTRSSAPFLLLDLYPRLRLSLGKNPSPPLLLPNIWVFVLPLNNF